MMGRKVAKVTGFGPMKGETVEDSRPVWHIMKIPRIVVKCNKSFVVIVIKY